MLFHLSDFMSQMIDDLCPRDIWAWGLCILIIYHYIKQTSFMWSVHRSPFIPKKKNNSKYCTVLNLTPLTADIQKRQYIMVFRTCQAYLVTILIPMCQVLIIPNRRMLTCRSEHLLTHSVTVGRSIALWGGCFQESTKESGPSLLTFITDRVYWPSYQTLLIDLHKWPWLFDLYNIDLHNWPWFFTSTTDPYTD